MQKDFTSFFVGVFTILGLVLLTFLISWKGGYFSRLQGMKVLATFQDINGVVEGAEVRYRGYRVGTVDQILPQPSNILVVMKINSKLILSKNTLVKIAFDGLIGEKFIRLQPDNNNKELYQEGEILVGNSSAGIVEFIDTGTTSLDQANKILELIYKMLEDQSLANSTKRILLQTEKATLELNTLLPTLTQLSHNLSQLTNNINKNTLSEIHIFLNKANMVTDEVNKFIPELSKLSNNINDNTLKEFNLMLKNISSTTLEINAILKELSSE